jgi:histidinol-phosphate aminotransferase
MNNRFIRSEISAIKPYIPGEQPKDKTLIKLNTNENPYMPAPLAIKAMEQFDPELARLYPDPDAGILKDAVAERFSVDAQQVFVGNGSDEVLAFIYQAYFGKGDKIAFPDITYSFYPVYANLYGADFITIPVNEDFTISFEAYPKDLKGIMLANPNAPTGIAISRAQIKALLEERPGTLFVVDEAYVDFGAESAVRLVNEFDNIIVVQTLSKSYALAGLRAGFAIANTSLIQGLGSVKNSFNSYTINAVTLRTATAAIKDMNWFEETCAKIIATREWFVKELSRLNILYTDSKSNFVFAKVPMKSGAEAQAFLREQNILVRSFPQKRIVDWLRITIGTDEQMRTLVNALERICST